MVVDVALTPQGWQKGAVEQILTGQGVAMEDAVTVDPQLEETLLASRFFEPGQPAKVDDGAPATGTALVYVTLRAGQVDEILADMRSTPADIAGVDLDLAILPNDQALFTKLRETVAQQAAPVAAEPPDKRRRRAAAYRLALSPGWRGTPARKLRGLDALAGVVPDWMLGEGTAQQPPIAPIPGQPLPKVPLPPGGRLGENIEVELLIAVQR
jgi:hypothetical protein